MFSRILGVKCMCRPSARHLLIADEAIDGLPPMYFLFSSLAQALRRFNKRALPLRRFFRSHRRTKSLIEFAADSWSFQTNIDFLHLFLFHHMQETSYSLWIANGFWGSRYNTQIICRQQFRISVCLGGTCPDSCPATCSLRIYSKS